jgi:transcriptional regulator with XRE-family HTH domain
MTIGKRIREARGEADMTEEQFADQLGVSPATLKAWEAEVQTPSDEQLQRFAEVAGIDAGALSHLARSPAPKGICSPVDLVPDSAQAEALEQAGLPRELWQHPDRWVAFLRLSAAAADLSPDDLSRLSHRAEACVLDDEE